MCCLVVGWWGYRRLMWRHLMVYKTSVGYPALPGTISQFHREIVPCRLICGPCGLWVGVSPPQIKFLHTNPPRGATFVCWPPPNSLPFRVLQMGSLKGVPPGVNISGCPLARCRARVKWGAHAKFQGDWLCRSGGRPPDLHTHIHTFIFI